MKNQSPFIALVFLLLTTFSSCAVVDDTFKSGMGAGVLSVVVVVALIIFHIGRMVKHK